MKDEGAITRGFETIALVYNVRAQDKRINRQNLFLEKKKERITRPYIDMISFSLAARTSSIFLLDSSVTF